MENLKTLLKWMTGGTPIFGNTHMPTRHRQILPKFLAKERWMIIAFPYAAVFQGKSS